MLNVHVRNYAKTDKCMYYLMRAATNKIFLFSLYFVSLVKERLDWYFFVFCLDWHCAIQMHYKSVTSHLTDVIYMIMTEIHVPNFA